MSWGVGVGGLLLSTPSVVSWIPLAIVRILGILFQRTTYICISIQRRSCAGRVPCGVLGRRSGSFGEPRNELGHNDEQMAHLRSTQRIETVVTPERS